MNEFAEAKKVGIIGIIGNVFLLFIKLGIAIFSRSQGMIADTINSFLDIFASLMTYFGGKISSKPKDANHAFGHAKAEYIFSFIISLFMLFLGINIFKDSVLALALKEKFNFSYTILIVCVITIIVKFILYTYTKKVYVKTKSLIVKANMQDHKNDIILTSQAFIGVFLGIFNIYFIDSIMGMMISIVIALNGVTLLIESSKILMDSNLSENELKEISKIVLKNKKISHIDSIVAKPVGAKFIIILKISMDGNLTLKESHNESAKIKDEIFKKHNNIMDIIIHVNPDE